MQDKWPLLTLIAVGVGILLTEYFLGLSERIADLTGALVAGGFFGILFIRDCKKEEKKWGDIILYGVAAAGWLFEAVRGYLTLAVR